MKYIRQFVILLLILYIGNVISDFISEVVLFPGSIIGMLILFLLLKTGLLKLEQIEGVADFIFSILPIFFIPAGISLLNYLELISANLVPILFIGILVTIIALAVTMKTVDVFANLQSKRGESHE